MIKSIQPMRLFAVLFFSAIFLLTPSPSIWANSQDAETPKFEEIPGTGLPSDVPAEPEARRKEPLSGVAGDETPTEAPRMQAPSAARRGKEEPVDVTPVETTTETPAPEAPAEAVPAETAPVTTESAPASSDGSTEASPVVATAPPSAPPTHKTYRVWIWQENGDSLSKIAQKVYGDRSKWKLIYLANKDTIKDPNKIYPKQKLKIPPADWQPD
jgi:nucleoid-associated protein YgaU